MKQPRIDVRGKEIGGDRIFIIAEIGKNFIETEDERPVAEYLENAKRLVDAAVASGVDAVKFQTHEVEDEVLNIDFTSPHFKAKDRYSWVSRNTHATPLDEFWKPLKAYCDEQGIIFFSTPMSRMAGEKLAALDVPLWKIGSGDVEDHLMLEQVAKTGKPLIISTGMVSFDELRDVVTHTESLGIPLVVLYCISQYPAPADAFNLASIERFKEAFPNAVVGFSDHSITHDAALRAMKLGARVIEKHFSFSRDHWGADHKASITPAEMRELVDSARSRSYESVEVGEYYGERERELEGATNTYRPYFNKALMAGRDIEAGEVITSSMLYAMRPVALAGGLPANRLRDVVGKRASRAHRKYDPITLDSVEY